MSHLRFLAVSSIYALRQPSIVPPQSITRESHAWLVVLRRDLIHPSELQRCLLVQALYDSTKQGSHLRFLSSQQ